MKHVLVVQQYVTASQVYQEIASSVLSDNDILFINTMDSVNTLLNSLTSIGFNVNSGVGQVDGWTYFKAAAKPVASGFPVVVLPTNDELFPPVQPIPADYEVRARVYKQI